MTHLVKSVYDMLTSTPSLSHSNLLSLADNELLKVANELNTIFDKEFDIALPEIVVVGSQSSGKSSTLNGLINMNILPTGKQIVTRTPTNIRLVNRDKKECSVEFYEYDGSETKILKTFNLDPYRPNQATVTEIQQEITELTCKYAGKQKNIIDNPIRINIYSPNVPNLVLTDLPGMVSVALEDQGQPANISDQIKDMISKYISKKNCIIMSIVPATIDIETDPSRALVKFHDPDGERTIGVFTKSDIAGSECDLSKYIDGRQSSSLKLKYGYYAVKNVRQEEITEGKDAYLVEKEYFDTHIKLKQVIDKNRLGINNLGSSLSKILINSIKLIGPELIEKIRETELTINNQLEEIGYEHPTTSQGKRVMVNTLISDFQKVFASSIRDRGSVYNTGTKLGAIYKKFKIDMFAINVFDKTILTDNLVKDIVLNYEGIHMPSSTTPVGVLELCFSGFVTDKSEKIDPIKILKNPIIMCMKNVQIVILELIDSILNEDKFSRFPNMVHKIRNTITDTIMPDKYDKTSDLVNDILQSEKECIWTDDMDFRKVLMAQHTKSENDSIREVLNTYYIAIKKIVSHNIHKLIQTFFVGGLINELNMSLLTNVMADTFEDMLLMENDEKARKREMLTRLKESITRAKYVIFNSKALK
jgi:GTP-binding protein EngB required for normal cell division